jgi:hypothetical protein
MSQPRRPNARPERGGVGFLSQQEEQVDGKINQTHEGHGSNDGPTGQKPESQIEYALGSR